jgi:hypothetical protein
MANFRLVHLNHFDGASMLSATSAVATLPVDNLRATPRELVWRSTSLSTQVVSGHYAGIIASAGYFGLHNHLCQGASVRVQLYSDTALTAQVYDSGTLAIATNVVLSNPVTWGLGTVYAQNTDLLYWEQAFNLWFSPVLHQGFKITISGTPGAYGYFQVGRMFLGPYLELAINAADVTLAWVDNSTRSRANGGSLRVNAGYRWRRMEVTLASLREADRPAMLDLMAYLGQWRDVVACLFAGNSDARLDRDYTINGRIVGSDPLVMANVRTRSKKLVIEEN